MNYIRIDMSTYRWKDKHLKMPKIAMKYTVLGNGNK